MIGVVIAELAVVGTAWIVIKVIKLGA